MDQGHIQGDSMVESYLHHQLTPEERTQFEAHLVDCEACRDRVLLAEMFHVRNGLVRQEPAAPEVEIISPSSSYRPLRVTPLPKRARFVAGLEPWQIWVILTAAALLLVLIPTSYFILSGR
jgi:anti-sigma factor RsiW